MIRLQYQLISTKYTRVYILKFDLYDKDRYNLEKSGLKRRESKKENYRFDDSYVMHRNETLQGASKRASKEKEGEEEREESHWR